MDAVLVVSQDERRQFDEVAAGRVHVVTHATESTPTPRRFHERTGILFVGSFHELSPNADAAVWFATRVLPALRGRLGDEVRFTIVGEDPPDEILDLRADGVNVVGSVPDLAPLYDVARVFVAPTRFAAGIPLKVIHAAAHGLPVVATSLLARQLQWRDDEELLMADSPEEFGDACAAVYQDFALWHRVRAAALARVSADYSMRAFRAAVAGALPVLHGDERQPLDDAKYAGAPTVRP
jgi:glycosyltransferase involved in cell wall biosynthesis